MFSNDEQVEGFAGVLDNLGVVAIAPGIVFVAGFGGDQVSSWILFLLLLAGAGSIYGAFCLRKLLPILSAPSETLATPKSLPSSSLPTS